MSALVSPVGYHPGSAESRITRRWTPLRYHAEQQRFARSPARFKTLPAGRRSGKTELSKRRLVKAALRGTAFPRPSFFAGAPTRDQAKRIFWDDLKAMVPRWAMQGTPSESELMIRLITGAELWVIGLDKPERIEGKAWDGGVITEIANCKAHAWQENIRPVFADRHGWAILEGVPEGRNFYYDLHSFALADQSGEWDGFHWTSADILPAEEIIAARRDLDELSFQQEFEASFVNFRGRAYYAFDRATHAAKPLPYNPRDPLILCFDFNVAPGVAAVAQETKLPNGKIGTAIIGEVWIENNSNTEAVCRRLILDWGGHEGRIMLYGDSTGGSRGSAKLAGSDWEIIKREMNKHFGSARVFDRVPRENPSERARINAMNTRIRNGDSEVHFMIDPRRCPQTIKDFEGTILLAGGSGEIDKKADPMRSHLSDSVGYYVTREFPIHSRGPATIKTTGH